MKNTHRRRARRTEKKRPVKFRLTLIRFAACIVIFGIVFLMKSYAPNQVKYINEALNYNTDLEAAQNTAREFILKYSPIP